MVRMFPSSQETTELEPVEQSVGLPVQGIHKESSIIETFIESPMVQPSLSLQETVSR